MSNRALIVTVILFLTLLCGLPLNAKGSVPSQSTTDIGFWLALPQNNTLLTELHAATDIRVHDTSQSFKGLTIQTIGIYPNYTGTNERVGYLAVMNADGDILNGFYLSDDMPIFPQFINSTTIVHCVKGHQNVSLWNLATNVTEQLLVPRGHHDIDYNGLTNTFLGIDGVDLQTYDHEGSPYTVSGDDIVEYDWDGTEIWRWESNFTFPFNVDEFHLVNETKKSEIDWMHANSLYWDVDADMIYMNVRSRDCFVKVNHATNETVWVLGRYIGEGPGLTLYNKHGQQVDSLFYHAHAVELIGSDRFIVYDNDYYNLTRPNPEIGITRAVEIVVNETAGTATEVWSWTAPASYYCNSQGDANRLPNGNTYVLFSQTPEPLFTEVNQAEEIVWEMVLNLTVNEVGWRTSANGAEHFFEEPMIVLEAASYNAYEGEPVTIGFSAWDVFKRRHTTDVTVRVLEGSTVLTEQDLELLPHWQETTLALTVSGLPVGLHNILIEIENPDGITGTMPVLVNITPALLHPTNLALIAGVAVVVVVVIVVIVVFYRRRASLG
jgi:hypothetical protein